MDEILKYRGSAANYRSSRFSYLYKRITNSKPLLNNLFMLHIFRIKGRTVSFQSSSNNEAIIKREVVALSDMTSLFDRGTSVEMNIKITRCRKFVTFDIYSHKAALHT